MIAEHVLAAWKRYATALLQPNCQPKLFVQGTEVVGSSFQKFVSQKLFCEFCLNVHVCEYVLND